MPPQDPCGQPTPVDKRFVSCGSGNQLPVPPDTGSARTGVLESGVMKYGFVVPWAREVEFVELARLAEDSGWDLVCTWEPVFGQDPWGQLAAAAVSTARIRLGTLLTPVPARRPWELAAQCGTVDRLSNGRLTLGVGLGAVNANWSSFLPDEGRATRAAQLDEGLAIWSGLLAGQPFAYAGAHWRVEPVTELAPPPPVQQPHPPVWCVGALVPGKERQPSLERAARWQGILPAVVGQEGHSGLTHERFDDLVTRLRGIREGLGLPWEGYDVVVEGDSHGDFGAIHDRPQSWADQGATWWVESWWDLPDSPEGLTELRRRIAAGPPR